MKDTSSMTIVGNGAALQGGSPGGEPLRCSLTFPDVCVLPSGRWLAACRAAPTKAGLRGQHVLLFHSDDEGSSWCLPRAPFEPLSIEGKPGLFRTASLTPLGGDEVLAALAWVDHSDPDAAFFNEETQGLLDTRIFLARSHDGGSTWSPPVLMNTSPFHVPTPLTGPVIILQNGEWACQFELNKYYNDLIEWRHSSIVMFSQDEGATWPEYFVVSSDPDNRCFYWDQRLSVSPDGILLDLFWTYDNHKATYLDVHARQSEDNGRTWSAMWDTGVPGQPAQPVFLSDGSIVMVVVNREAEPTIKAHRSFDGGRIWSQETDLYRLESSTQTEGKGSMQDAWAEMAKYSVGLPTTALLPDGDILTLFYAGEHTDATDVRWIRLRTL